MKNFLSLSVIFLLFSCTGAINKESIREISQGLLIGKNSENNTFSWKGIPFAKPPINELRWKAPQMAMPWEGLFEATDFKDECFQREIRTNLRLAHPAPIFQLQLQNTISKSSREKIRN